MSTLNFYIITFAVPHDIDKRWVSYLFDINFDLYLNRQIKEYKEHFPVVKYKHENISIERFCSIVRCHPDLIESYAHDDITVIYHWHSQHIHHMGPNPMIKIYIPYREY